MRWLGESAVHQFRMPGLKRQQLLKKGIILAVGDNRIVKHMIAMGMKTDLLAALLQSVSRPLLRRYYMSSINTPPLAMLSLLSSSIKMKDGLLRFAGCLGNHLGDPRAIFFSVLW
jgi:hypothetical protein